MGDKGWGFLNNAGKSSSYHGADGSWGYTDEDGSGSYHGADGSWGYKNADGSGSYHGADGSWGYFNEDGSSSYHGADGSWGYSEPNKSDKSYNSCTSCVSNNDDDSTGVGAVLGLLLGGAAIWAISKLFK